MCVCLYIYTYIHTWVYIIHIHMYIRMYTSSNSPSTCIPEYSLNTMCRGPATQQQEHSLKESRRPCWRHGARPLNLTCNRNSRDRLLNCWLCCFLRGTYKSQPVCNGGCLQKMFPSCIRLLNTALQAKRWITVRGPRVSTQRACNVRISCSAARVWWKFGACSPALVPQQTQAKPRHDAAATNPKTANHSSGIFTSCRVAASSSRGVNFIQELHGGRSTSGALLGLIP